MADKGYIKIDRKILDWRWFHDSKTFHVFIWLLLKANIKDHDFRKFTVKRGSLATSYESIADGCGLSVSSVRRVIASLEETEEIKRTIRDHYQVIEIVNYDLYQSKTGCSQRTAKTQPVEQPLEQANDNNQRMKRMNKHGKNIPPKSPKGDSSPSEPPQRGTDAFRNVSHLLLKPEEGTLDDIPVAYRDAFKTFAEYCGSRNQ